MHNLDLMGPLHDFWQESSEEEMEWVELSSASAPSNQEKASPVMRQDPEKQEIHVSTCFLKI